MQNTSKNNRRPEVFFLSFLMLVCHGEEFEVLVDHTPQHLFILLGYLLRELQCFDLTLFLNIFGTNLLKK